MYQVSGDSTSLLELRHCRGHNLTSREQRYKTPLGCEAWACCSGTREKYYLLHIQNSVPFVFSLDILTKTAKKPPSNVTEF
jgi:hypothetical protein